MNIEEIVKNIIKEQSMIIGRQLAFNRASDSGVVKFNSSNLEDITVTRSPTLKGL